ncbi:hypothetical protein PVAND_001150 [Polypedilum vanderplanki]|uniref:Uncharacterized protein n=1 Tax=Polypedilum vanderplanki TaxID=319348 RepID=A0A9J6BM18_POLVA|nr:hypothetical protein PVAND_001150 [Polypedilum vanderplanki]
MFYQPIDDKNPIGKMRENIMLSTSTSNSSFLNGNNFEGNDDRLTLTLDCETRDNYREPMSKIRKIAFIASISSCILVVIVFLFLPCNKNCVAKHQLTKFTKTINWIKSYEKLELKGSINTVGSANKNSPLNLIFMYRNDKIFPDLTMRKNKIKSNGGIMKINGNSGEIDWQNSMTNEPMYIDCSLIDCDNNGVNDCLVLDAYFQLACIDETGHWIYYNSNSKSPKIRNFDLLDFPLILPDLTNDNVKEIMMSSNNGKNNTTNLVLLSGNNGKILAEETQNCSSIHKLQIDSDYVIKFICVVKENIEQQIFKNLTDFYTLMTKKPVKKLQPISAIKQHKYFGRRASTNAQKIITNIQDKELVIDNKDVWPKSKMSLKLTGKKDGDIINYYTFTGSKIYAFTPVTFSLNVSISKSRKDNIHGFIVKFWTWNGTDISYNLEKSRPKRDLKTQRSNYTNQNQTFATYKTKVRFLKESILLIVFNSTNMKAENVSASDIVQFCQKPIGSNDADDDSICQPDLSYQENSILITDIDNDGSKELVSYYSSFYDENQGDNIVTDRWKLKTYIQLFKLETELPKLYGSDYDIF